MKQSVDHIDQKILKELQADASRSHQTIGELAGLSPSPCSRRIRIMEAEGIIEGYSARVDENRLGFSLSVFVSVKLDRQIDNNLVSFERGVALCPEVVDCWLMTGNRDYLLRVAVADLSEFEDFLTQRLTRLQGVASIESSIPIRRVKGQLSRIM